MERKVLVKEKNIQNDNDILYNIVKIIYDDFIDNIIENSIRKLESKDDDNHKYEIYEFTITHSIFSIDAQLDYTIEHIVEYLGNNHFEDYIDIRKLYNLITDKSFYKVNAITRYTNNGDIYIYGLLDGDFTKRYGKCNKAFLKQYYSRLVADAIINSCMKDHKAKEYKTTELIDIIDDRFLNRITRASCTKKTKAHCDIYFEIRRDFQYAYAPNYTGYRYATTVYDAIQDTIAGINNIIDSHDHYYPYSEEYKKYISKHLFENVGYVDKLDYKLDFAGTYKIYDNIDNNVMNVLNYRELIRMDLDKKLRKFYDDKLYEENNTTTEEEKEEAATMEKEIAKVDILGTEYTITKKKFDDDSSTDGYIDWTDKTITIYDYDNYQFGDEVTLHDKKELMNQALRHEIIHAFLYESGLGDNWEHKAIGQEETVVDWIAYQFNKIKAVYDELGI